MTREEAIKVLTEINYNSIENDTVVATHMAIKALEQEPNGDLISREETLTAFADYVGSGMSMDDYDALWNIVTKMPSVKQEPKTGHREYNDIYDHYLCGNCKTIVMDYDNYCPNCGARMESEVSE